MEEEPKPLSPLEKFKTAPRSVSQVNAWRRCSYAVYLERVKRVWQRPAAWLPQGTAVHKAAEEYERSGRLMPLDEAQDVFRESYAEEVNRYCEGTPNFDYWFASGPYKGEADIERRYGIGLGQVENYLNYYQGKGNREWIWTAPDGTKGIELPFEVDLDGITVRGYIDAVIIHPDHGLLVRDNKTGNKPGDDFQLKVYAVALETLYGVEAKTGDYWMGRTGEPTKVPYDLTRITTDEVVEEFHKVDEEIKSEVFVPTDDKSKCDFCPVSSSCPFAGR